MNSETVGICTFFEAQSIGCRKMIFDVKKVTYDMYSYEISCMSREMMGTDVRDSAKCQKSKLGDIDGIIGFVLNDNKTKLCIVLSPLFKKNQKHEKGVEMQ